MSMNHFPLLAALIASAPVFAQDAAFASCLDGLRAPARAAGV